MHIRTLLETIRLLSETAMSFSWGLTNGVFRHEPYSVRSGNFV